MSKTSSSSSDDEIEVRKGPWTVEEDTLLVNYIAHNGEGRWNLLAKSAGLKRSGKSCRLRWLNYLKPDIKRGNLTPQEQLLILELHSKLGNRWSKIAQYLPGRTDNEIKNYWRTRVQKQAKYLKIDSNSTAFQEMIRNLWIPRLLQKIQSSSVSQNALLTINKETQCPQASQSFNMPKSPRISESPQFHIDDSDLNSFVKPHFQFDNNGIYDMDTFTSAATANFRDVMDYDQKYLIDDVLTDNVWSIDEFY